jgi:hypothetical protein
MNVDTCAAPTPHHPAGNADRKPALPQPYPKPDFYGTTATYRKSRDGSFEQMDDQNGNSVLYMFDKNGKRTEELDLQFQNQDDDVISQTFVYDDRGNRIAKSPPRHEKLHVPDQDVVLG